MGIIICDDCKKYYSNFAEVCPQCARPTNTQGINIKSNVLKKNNYNADNEKFSFKCNNVEFLNCVKGLEKNLLFSCPDLSETLETNEWDYIILKTDKKNNKLFITSVYEGISSIIEFIDAEVKENIEIVIPLLSFSSLLSGLSESDLNSVKFQMANDLLIVRTDKFIYKFPDLKVPIDSLFDSLESQEDILPLRKNFFLEISKKATQFCSTKSDHTVISGVNILLRKNEVKVASTDGYRLNMLVFKKTEKDVENLFNWELINNSDEFSITIDRKILTFISYKLLDSKSKDIQFYFDIKNQILQVDSCQYEFPSYEDNYPNYESFIPNKFLINIIFSRRNLLEKLKRLNTISREYGETTIFNIVPNTQEVQIILHGNNSVEKIRCQKKSFPYKRRNFKIAFNISYLIECLAIFSSDNIILECNNPEKAAIFRSDDYIDKHLTHLIMPIILDSQENNNDSNISNDSKTEEKVSINSKSRTIKKKINKKVKINLNKTDSDLKKNNSSNINLKILLVEDDRDMSDLIAGHLESHDFEVQKAEDGVIAQELARQYMPDCMIINSMLPRLDGFTLCRKIRNDQKTAVIPLLMMSVMENLQDISAFNSIADDFITIPFDLDELTHRIKALIKTHCLKSN